MHPTPGQTRPASIVAAILILPLVLAGCFGESEQRMVQSTGGSIGSGAPGTPGAGEPGSGEEVLPPFVPAPVTLRQLLASQYRGAIRTLLGNEASVVVTPPADSAVNGFDAIGAAQLSLSPDSIDKYERSAHKAVEVAFQDASRKAALVPCSPKSATDAACFTQVIETFGARAFRRPLSAEELAKWLAVAQEAGTAYADFYKGAQFVLAGLLQSPNFLYLVEVGEPDPAQPDRLRLTSYELAARLAFFLTGTLPDDELLAAAEAGALHTADGLRAQAWRLLEKPEAKGALARFFDEALHLRDLDYLVKDPATFPEFTPALAKSMREETRLLLEDVVWTRDADFRDVFDATYTFVNQDLAALYGLQGAPATGFGRVELDPTGRRGGYLGHASFLAMMAHPRSTSPTHRGKFVRERLLCKTIPAPPNNVDTTLKETASTAEMTMRERLAEHQSNPACAGCHVLMDDVGLGLENFDSLGRFRELDNGKPIDAVSKFDELGVFAGALELGKKLREDERVTSCLVRNVFRMATGHVDTEGEYAPLRHAEKAFADSGYRMKALLVEIAASDAFRFAAAQEVQP